MSKLLHRLLFLIVLFLPLTVYSQSDFFSHQPLCSSEELDQLLKEKTLDMCWQVGSDSHFRFVSKNDEVYFEICLGSLPTFYDDFVHRVKDKFVESRPSQLIFSYKSDNEEINRPQNLDQGHPDDDSYIVTERRVFEGAHPQYLSHKALEVFIKESKVLFYTGAGISIDSGVPAMSELNELLGLEEGKKFLLSLEKAIHQPKEFASKIAIFHKACLLSHPTMAHIALRELAIFKSCRLITENLDCLHEASGIHPYRINAAELRNEGSDLAKFEYIVCVGLSFDDHGFLAWFKQQNPRGKIIAIDIKKPSYLGDEDFLVLGDLQKIIPSLQSRLSKTD
jgi:NAD-dependent SIR2 family protein deacetylase